MKKDFTPSGIYAFFFLSGKSKILNARILKMEKELCGASVSIFFVQYF
jgi:hypothetical protein